MVSIGLTESKEKLLAEYSKQDNVINARCEKTNNRHIIK